MRFSTTLCLLSLALQAFAANATNPQPDAPLQRDACALELLRQAERLWTPTIAHARLMHGQYDTPLILAFRLRSYHKASALLATQLVLSPQGLPVLVVAATESVDNAKELLPGLLALLTPEDQQHLTNILASLKDDVVMASVCARLKQGARLLYPSHPQYQNTIALDPIFLPMMGRIWEAMEGKPNASFLSAAEADLSSRYSLQQYTEMLTVAIGATDNSETRQFLAAISNPAPAAVSGDFVLPKNVKAISPEAYFKGLQNSAPFQGIESLNQTLFDAWDENFGHLHILTRTNERFPLSRWAPSLNGISMSQALYALIKGSENDFQKHLTQAFADIRSLADLSETEAQTIEQAVRTAASDKRFRLLFLGQFVAMGKVSPEEFLIHLAMTSWDIVEERSGLTARPLLARFQQVPMIYAALLYGHLAPGSNILEIGPDRPVIPAALKYYLPHIGKIVTVDVRPPLPKEVTEKFRPSGISFLRGNPPQDRAVAEQIKKSGPYNLIYGVDVFRQSYEGVGENFAPGVSNLKYLKWVYENLADHGMYLVLNDNRAEPNFSQSEARQAGFTVVRWGEDWEIPLSLREMSITTDRTTGEMALYVLQKGEPEPLPTSGVIVTGE